MKLCKCGCELPVAKKNNTWIIGHHYRGKKVWNSGKTKNMDSRIASNPCWSKGLTKETDSRLMNVSIGVRNSKVWNKGLTKETDPRVKKLGELTLIRQTRFTGNTPFDRLLRRKFGITENKYNRLLKKQNMVCAICHQPEKSKMKGTLRRLAVDHNHETGKVRGLLCNNCNRGLGLFMDNPDWLQTAVYYIKNTIKVGQEIMI
jgi:hypothetical protein